MTDKSLKKLSPKDTVEAVFEGMGGVNKMTEWAKDNPGTFYTQLYGKLVAQPIDLNFKGVLRIELPWLASRPGRPPVTLEQLPDGSHQPLQVSAEASVHTPPQPDATVRVRGLPQKKRQNGSPGK